jgi:hypothetical protein
MRKFVAIFSSHGVSDSHVMGQSQSKSLFLQPRHSHVMRKPTKGSGGEREKNVVNRRDSKRQEKGKK